MTIICFRNSVTLLFFGTKFGINHYITSYDQFKDIKGSVLNIASHSLKKLPNLEEKSNKYIWLEMNITSILVILFITQVCSVNGLKCTLRRCNQCATVFTEQMGTMQQQHFCGDYIETHCCRIMKSSSVRRLF